MQYNIYFRKENWDRFKDEESKSALINELLAEYYGDSADAVRLAYDPVQRTVLGRPAADLLETTVDEDKPEKDFYTDLILYQATNEVINTVTGEQVEDRDPEMIKELKRRKQVK